MGSCGRIRACGRRTPRLEPTELSLGRGLPVKPEACLASHSPQMVLCLSACFRILSARARGTVPWGAGAPTTTQGPHTGGVCPTGAAWPLLSDWTPDETLETGQDPCAVRTEPGRQLHTGLSGQGAAAGRQARGTCSSHSAREWAQGTTWASQCYAQRPDTGTIQRSTDKTKPVCRGKGMGYLCACSTHRPQSDGAEGSPHHTLLQGRPGHMAGTS